jgi:hypothetical protein
MAAFNRYAIFYHHIIDCRNCIYRKGGTVALNELLGEDPYYVLVYVSFDIDGVKNPILTTFNKSQARVGREILQQEHNRRSQWGLQILQLLESKRQTRELKWNTHVSATLYRGNLIERMPVTLHWRTVRLLGLACATNQEPLIRQLASVLEKIECGIYEAKSTIRPFEYLEKLTG